MDISSAKVLQLGPKQKGRILRHFLALSEQDRILRFGSISSDAVLAQYVESIDFQQDIFLAVAPTRGPMLALAHLALRQKRRIDALQYMAPPTAELGLSVLKKARGMGLGSRLFEMALDHCRLSGVASLYMHCLASNQTMLHIAQKAGMQIMRDHGEADAYLQFPLPLSEPISAREMLYTR